MDECIVVGKRVVDFEAKDGMRIQGFTLYVQRNDPNVEGYVTEKLFVRSSNLGKYVPSLGDVVVPIFNRYGKVAGLNCVDHVK